MKYIILSIIIILSNEAYSQKVDSLTHYSIGWVKQHKDMFKKNSDSTVISQVGNVYVLKGKRYWWKEVQITTNESRKHKSRN